MGWTSAGVFDGARWYDWNSTDPDEHQLSARHRQVWLSVDIYDSTVVTIEWMPDCSGPAYLCGTPHQEHGELAPDRVTASDADRAARELSAWLSTHVVEPTASFLGPDSLAAVIRPFLAHDEEPERDQWAEWLVPEFFAAAGIPLPRPDEVSEFR